MVMRDGDWKMTVQSEWERGCVTTRHFIFCNLWLMLGGKTG